MGRHYNREINQLKRETEMKTVLAGHKDQLGENMRVKVKVTYLPSSKSYQDSESLEK